MSFKVKLREKLEGLVGFYMSGLVRELAISDTYAIDREVLGLEVVIARGNSDTTPHPGGAVETTAIWEVFLTQHEGGRNTFQEAINSLKLLGYPASTRYLKVSKQVNVKRAIVTITTKCDC